MTPKAAEFLVLKATCAEDVFGLDASRQHAEYRRLAALLHPDTHPAMAGAMAKLTQWNRLAEERIKAGTYGQKTTTIIRNRKQSYTLSGQFVDGELSKVYSAVDGAGLSIALKIARSRDVNDLLENEHRVLSFLLGEGPTKHLPTVRHLPSSQETFLLPDGRRVNAISEFSGCYSLTEVRAAYPQGVDTRTMAWMFNRLLGAFTVCHQAGFVHANVNPDHALIRPDDHFGALVDWSYAVKTGETARAISPKWKSLYPPEVLQGEALTPATDLYMAAKCICYVTGERALEVKPIASLLRTCLFPAARLRVQDALELAESFRDLLKALYGKPKFHPFTMPAKG